MIENYKSIFDMISLPVIVKDLSNNIVTMNVFAKELLIHKKNLSVHNQLYNLLDEDKKRFYEDDLKVINSKKPVVGRLLELNLKDGDKVFLKFDKIPCFDAAGEVEYIFVIIQDLTELYYSKERFKKQMEFAHLGLNTAETIHNLKNTLTVAVGATNMLIDEQDNNSLPEIIKKAHGKMLDVFKANLEYEESEPQNCNIMDVINEVIEEIELAKDIDVRNYLKFIVDPNLFVGVNKTHLNQMLTNLINNSIEALETVSLKEIKIEAGLFFEEIIISITDNGSGIPEDIKTKIFNPSFTTKKYSNSLSCGNGLGLSYVDRMSKHYNGKVEVNSFPGGGSVFTLFLPLAREMA